MTATNQVQDVSSRTRHNAYSISPFARHYVRRRRFNVSASANISFHGHRSHRAARTTYSSLLNVGIPLSSTIPRLNHNQLVNVFVREVMLPNQYTSIFSSEVQVNSPSLIDVPVQYMSSISMENSNVEVQMINPLIEVPIQYLRPISLEHANCIPSAPLGTYTATSSSSRGANTISNYSIPSFTLPLRRRPISYVQSIYPSNPQQDYSILPSSTTHPPPQTRAVRSRSQMPRTRRLNFDFVKLLLEARRVRTREAERDRRRRSRAMQTESSRLASRERETIRQRNARLMQTAEKRASTKSENSNRRREARHNLFHPKTRLNAQAFRKACHAITWGFCRQCKIRFPGININNDQLCDFCKKDLKKYPMNPLFSAENYMDPGEVPSELSNLSALEQILIARINPIMSVYRVKGQQYKYGGNVINFSQDVNAIATKLPHRPGSLSSILIVRRTGTRGIRDFIVRREFVRRALPWLQKNHKHYNDILISEECLQELPEHGVPENLPQVQEEHDPNDIGVDQAGDGNGQPQFREEIFHIDEFESVGTLISGVQATQSSCISRVLHMADPDRTVVEMPITGDVIDELNTVGYISMAFPTLFPYGDADLRQSRERKVQPTQYFKYLMQYHDGRFAKDPRFRYFAWNSLSRWRAMNLGNIYFKLNPHDGLLSIQAIRNMISSNDKQLAARVSYYAHQIRGSRAYWYTRFKELTAMVKQIGPPTIFFTLSAADMQWPELYKLLDPSNVLQSLTISEQRKRRASLLNENLHIVAWFLQERVRLFLDCFLKSEFSVLDYWYRFEWQHRGSGHVHGFLWLKDAPDVTEIATNEEQRRSACDYFDHIVCTMNPDPTSSIPMNDHPCARSVEIDADLDCDDSDYISLVNWVMRHTKCGVHCMRINKITKKMACRFHFPHEVTEESNIVEEPLNSSKFKYVGCRNDQYVCSHNREVLQTWRANIDWSAVLSLQSVIYYIGKYAAKAEPASKNFIDTFRGIVEDLRRPCSTSKSVVQRLLMKSVSERDMSAQEVCHLLMGYALQKSSRKSILLNIYEENMSSSTLRKFQAPNNEDEEEEVVSDPSFVSRYMQRPTQFEDMSLLHMAKTYYFAKKKWCKSRVESIVRVLPEFEGQIIRGSDRWEQFCRQQVLLHQPFRSFEQAKGNYESWSALYDALYGTTENMNNEGDNFEDEFEDDNEAEYDLQNYEQDEWIFAAAMGGYFESRESELGLRDYDKNHDWSIGLLHYPNIKHGKGFMHTLQQNPLNSELPQSSLVLPLSDLSLEQRRAHDLIIMALVEKKPIRLIVCGGAGTGKSTLINAVVRSTTTMFGNNKTVRVMAPTGVAAFNIGGSTIHHELTISTDNNADYKPLESEQSRRMQEEFKDTKLIIIDEYSMVGKRMLANVDHRCRDIFASKEYFGNVSIVLFGDIRQLPLVFDSSLYAEKGNTMQHFGAGSYMCFDKCICLSQVFRQSGEEQQAFREALERLSIGDSTIEDWKLFQSRDYAMLKLEEKNEFRNALRLFPRRASAEEYNLKHLKELGNPVARIVSINNCETASNATSEHAKGLESVICLSVGARVMLRANLATSYGLVNGAMGTVKDIVYSSDGKSPTHMPLAVMVEFDMYDGPSFSEETRILPITPMTCHWKSSSGISCQRTQIPLVLCWACTVHKSQGLTLPKALVDIGESERLGMTFVALSRTKKLSDMAFSPMFSLQRLQRIKTCSELIRRMKEEERLRRLSYFSY